MGAYRGNRKASIASAAVPRGRLDQSRDFAYDGGTTMRSGDDKY
jgi:hypothetical protein